MRSFEKETLLTLAEGINGQLGHSRLAKGKKKASHDLPQKYRLLHNQIRKHQLALADYPGVEAFARALALGPAKAAELILEVIRRLQGEPVKYKVVFLPYMSSTWDCLESIYEAFARDSRFISDIVIIPTYRDTPAGRVSLYKDFLSENKIPHTLYTDYRIEQDKPDIVFACFPYDMALDSAFQAAHIRRHCKMLVYVPYFGVLSGLLNQKQAKMYDQPIHLLADKIIVQSALAVKAYELHCPGPKGRYLPLGIPKVDAYKKNAEKALARPKADWLAKINGRTVFLLDTHYAIHHMDRKLPDGRAYNLTLLLLQGILAYFAQRDDIFLIWRPHPLQETVLNESKPALDIDELKTQCDHALGFAAALKNCELNERQRLLQNLFPEVPSHNVAEKTRRLSQFIEDSQRIFIKDQYRQVLANAQNMGNCLIDREANSGLAAALSSAFISLSGGSLINLYPALNKPVIYYHLSGFPPPGDQYFVDINAISYHPQLIGIFYFIFYHIFHHRSGAPIASHPDEASLLTKLKTSTQQKYHHLVEKNRGREVYTLEFLATVKNKELSPELGCYFPYAHAYANQHGGYNSYLREEAAADNNEFEYHLYNEEIIFEIINYIEMIANGRDPLRENHYAHYARTIANSGQNCGQLTYEAIADNFMTAHNPMGN